MARQAAEKQAMDYQFETRRVDVQHTLTIRAAAVVDKLPELLGEFFGEVYAHILQHGQEPSGMPFSRYYDMDGVNVDFECGMPVASPIAGAGRVQAGELPAGTVATVTHMGPYDDLPQSWNALLAWMGTQGLDPAGPPWEVYFTDPGEEPDPAKWRTDIYVPVC